MCARDDPHCWTGFNEALQLAFISQSFNHSSTENYCWWRIFIVRYRTVPCHAMAQQYHIVLCMEFQFERIEWEAHSSHLVIWFNFKRCCCWFSLRLLRLHISLQQQCYQSVSECNSILLLRTKAEAEKRKVNRLWIKKNKIRICQYNLFYFIDTNEMLFENSLNRVRYLT